MTPFWLCVKADPTFPEKQLVRASLLEYRPAKHVDRNKKAHEYKH